MKLNKYICMLGLATIALTTACDDQSDLVTEINYSRLFAPINLEAKVTGQVNVRLNWSTVSGATSYVAEFYEDTDQVTDSETNDSEVLNYNGTPVKTVSNITADQLPIVVKGFESETKYLVRIQAQGEKGQSNWSGTRFKTSAEQIMQEVLPEELTATTVVLRWTPGEAAEKIVITPGDIEHAVTADEIAAGAATITGLTPETEYSAKLLKSNGKSRGSVTFTTLIDFGNATPVYAEDNLLEMLTAAEEGAEFIIVEGTHTIGDFELTKSMKISGFKPSEKPTINGRFTVASEVASLSLNNLIFDGAKSVSNLLEITNAAANLGNLEVNGCEVRNMAKHIIYNNAKGKLGTVSFYNCIIDGIANDSGDGFDLRGGALTSLKVSNTTISNGIRSLVRCQVVADVEFSDCTFYNICTSDDGNNTGLFRVEKAGSKLTVQNVLIANVGVASPQNANAGTFGRADKNKAEESLKNVVYFNSPNLWTNHHKDDYSSFAKEADPKFADAKNGDFTVGNEDVTAGDPRWLK